MAVVIEHAQQLRLEHHEADDLRAHTGFVRPDEPILVVLDDLDMDQPVLHMRGELGDTRLIALAIARQYDAATGRERMAVDMLVEDQLRGAVLRREETLRELVEEQETAPVGLQVHEEFGQAPGRLLRRSIRPRNAGDIRRLHGADALVDDLELLVPLTQDIRRFEDQLRFADARLAMEHRHQPGLVTGDQEGYDLRRLQLNHFIIGHALLLRYAASQSSGFDFPQLSEVLPATCWCAINAQTNF